MTSRVIPRWVLGLAAPERDTALRGRSWLWRSNRNSILSTRNSKSGLESQEDGRRRENWNSRPGQSDGVWSSGQSGFPAGRHDQAPGGTSVLMDQATYDELNSEQKSGLTSRNWGKFKPFGMTSQTEIVELVTDPSQLDPTSIAAFETAVKQFQDGDWQLAAITLQPLPDRDSGKRFLLDFMSRNQFTSPRPTGKASSRCSQNNGGNQKLAATPPLGENHWAKPLGKTVRRNRLGGQICPTEQSFPTRRFYRSCAFLDRIMFHYNAGADTFARPGR